MFYREDIERLAGVVQEHRRLSQLQGCVVDLLAARAEVTTQLDHLENAQANASTFVGPGEDRWVIIGDTAHHVTNVEGTINIQQYTRKEKLCL